MQQSAMKTDRRILFAGALLFLAAVAAAYMLRKTVRDRQLQELPDFDVSVVHPAARNAIVAAEDEVRAQPGSASSWGELGMVYMAHECPTQALACFAVAHRLDQADFRWLYLPGVIHEQSDFAAARESYLQAAALRPRFVPLLLRLASVSLVLDDLKAAERYANAAADADATRALPFTLLGRIERLRGNLAAAATHLEQAAAKSPMDQQVRLELANVYYLLGDQAQAVRCRQDAAALPDVPPPFDDPVLLQVQQLESTARRPADMADSLALKGQLDAAAEIYRGLIRDYPELSGPRLSYANLLLRAGRTNEAAREFRELLERFPDEALGWYGLGYALQATGDAEGAISALENCILRKPDFAEGLLSLGYLQQQAGASDDALESFRRAIDASPGFGPAHLAIGELLVRRGEPAAGIRHLQTAVRLSPDDPIARRLLDNALQNHNELP